ncbi:MULTISPECIES: ABC transporter permease [Mycobacteriaceae]|uniref:ABC transporter permease n=1 Tax=Mycolicibacterium parafortuitum TaxID=39692 RepID=A0ACC6MND4_MYCPF|nr:MULTISPECIES: ABC transporter permease [Mycobacteriaceae]MBX7447597.1 ABC transporter permease [Mycolicibacterium aurantiacum]MDZ5088448.1 ABC transporter permease [Mycolicibacterium parafortuitum]GFM19967.1 ABC transporter [Mycobacterium sp. PO1]GFM23920.1 ABC transporter [Mycobacterium sp. PO2]
MSTTTEEPRVLAASTTTATPRRAAAHRARRIVLPALVLLAGLALWVAVTYLVLDERRRFLLPPPWAVAHTGLVDPVSRSAIVAALTQTATVALTGLGVAVLVGVTIAVLMSQARWLEESIYPYAVIVQTLPIVAIVPLVGLWLGFNFSSRVIVCVVMSLFPIITNTLFGLKSADPGLHDLATLHNASRWTRLRTIAFPNALPAMFTGIRIAGGLSVIGAIVSDFFFRQGYPGIGRLLDIYRANLNYEGLIAAIFASSSLGIVVFWFIGWLGQRVTGAWTGPGR